MGFHDDMRDYRVAADMLKALDVDRITLLSNNPDKEEQLEEAGISIEKRIPTGVFASPSNHRYLEAKARHTHHTIDLASAYRLRPAAAA